METLEQIENEQKRLKILRSELLKNELQKEKDDFEKTIIRDANGEIKRVEAEEVIKFYASRFSWNFSKHPTYEMYAGEIKNDDSLVKYKEADGDTFEDYCGGKRAINYLQNKGEV